MKYIFRATFSTLLVLCSWSLQAQPTENPFDSIRIAIEDPGTLEQNLLGKTIVENERCTKRYAPMLKKFRAMAEQDSRTTDTQQFKSQVTDVISSCADVANTLLERNLNQGLYFNGDVQRAFIESDCGKALMTTTSIKFRIQQLIYQSSVAPIDSLKSRLTIYGNLSLAAHLADTMNTQAIWLDRNCTPAGTLTPYYLKKGGQ